MRRPFRKCFFGLGLERGCLVCRNCPSGLENGSLAGATFHGFGAVWLFQLACGQKTLLVFAQVYTHFEQES